LCSRCSREVRRGLLRLLAGQELLSLPRPPQEEPLTLPARVGWFVARLATYALIGAAVFAIVALLATR
jgi:hypothetical protein